MMRALLAPHGSSWALVTAPIDSPRDSDGEPRGVEGNRISKPVSKLLIYWAQWRVLIPPFGGSNPSTPARLEGMSHSSRWSVALGLCHDGKDNVRGARCSGQCCRSRCGG